MKIKYCRNIMQPVDGMQKIAAIAWSANSKKFAIATADRIVHLYDETAEKRDKFSTKSAKQGHKSYVVRAMAFSPDSMRLSIAQSDNIVFVYKLGTDWGERKSICNKFPQSSSVTCLCWPPDRHNEIAIGLAEGKVRIGQLKNNRSSNLFNTSSYVVSISSNPEGNAVVSGHLDGTIYKFDLTTGAQLKIGTHTSVPYALSWGVHILAAGNDGKVFFYDSEGGVYQRFEYGSDKKVKEFTAAHFNSNGDTVALGNFNKFYVYNFNPRRGQWDEVCCKKIENYYSVTALAWKADGSRLATGSLCGSVDLFDVCIKRTKYKGKFEFIYISISQVIVKRLETGSRIVLKSNYGYEITKINIYQDRYLVAQTAETLLLGDMESCKLSELLWRGSGKEKYDFSNPNVCMVFNAGELSIVEYGINQVIGTCRTEHVHPHLISARLNYAPQDPLQESKGEEGPTRIIAYLLDPQTACIQDISNSLYQATINHDAKIDFLELNPNGTRLLFRDKRKQLHLFNVKEQKKTTLLNFCTYVNWVPDSDVVVAQNRSTLCVWYSIDEPDKVTMYNIKGDVQEIERTEAKTEVIVYDGINTYSYLLDSPLIEFGAALEKRDLERAVTILEPQDLTPEVEANWKALANLALSQQKLVVAERCFAALGDICKAKYLRGLNKLVMQQEGDGTKHFRVQARLAMLAKEFFKAEEILLNQNEVEEAMEMYQEVHRWDESLKLAERVGVHDLPELEENYFQWLLESGQEAKAADVKARKGDYIQAVGLYLKAGFPAKAATLIMQTNVGFGQDMMERVAAALTGNKMHEKAGQFFERMDFPQRALDSYVRGNAYRKAIDLARRQFPQHVVPLEEKYGDYLVQQKDVEAAVEHYVQANCITKAIEAAMEARHWDKAVKLVTSQPTEVARPYYSKVARHYAEVRQLDLAEKYFLKAGEAMEAFDMYIRAHKWDTAYSVISRQLSENDVAMVYIKHAKAAEQENPPRLKDAERMYLTVNEPDLAINMYKKAKQYDHMIRLVVKYRRDLLKDTHLHLGKQLEMEGNLKQAEHHYIESGQWQGALKMYRAHEQWDDAYRVVRSNGTNKELTEFALKWAEGQGSENGTKLLLKLGLLDAAVEFKAQKEEFEEAFRLAHAHAKYKLQDVHLKYALHLEDNRRFKEAEEHYIKANKPTEAISMYEHQQDWHSALQVARQYHPDSVPQVAMNQGKHYLDRKDFQKAESCFINARQPEVAIRMYLEANLPYDAQRVASKHAPHLADEIYRQYIAPGAGH